MASISPDPLPSLAIRRTPMTWLMIAALIVAAGFTGFHTFRFVRDFIYWNIHADEPIQGWMTVGFVAHSYHLPPYVLEKAIGLPCGPPPDHRPLGQIARAKGVAFTAIKAQLENAIVHARPPYPPPGPPPQRTRDISR